MKFRTGKLGIFWIVGKLRTKAPAPDTWQRQAFR